MMRGRRGFEFTFGWIFAIIFGAVIIFLAVYMAFNIVSVERRSSDSSLSQGFNTLLYPVGTGLESDKITPIAFPVETKISFQCNSNGDFGEQIIRTSASSSLGNKYSDNPISARSKDKYIFSTPSVEGKTFMAFVKTLNMPFEITDLIYFIPITEKYCFMVSKTSTVGKEIEGFKKNNYYFNKTMFIEDATGCPENSNKICFNVGHNADCYASVNGNRIRKGNKTVYFDEGEIGSALLYAAIFSEPEYYECQLKRINKRTYELARLYLQKQQLSLSSCGLGLGAQLEAYANLTRSFNSSERSLPQVISLSKSLGRGNEELSCPLF
ncbi:MAG: hypothetical protein Q8Q31_02810 [Nanoarchaeota archaeon]|nr:hypothetical protein [Nanoarchaeota archaeon]